MLFAGDYRDSFMSSHFKAEIDVSLYQGGIFHNLLIDRSNGIKRSCLHNANWTISVKRFDQFIHTGALISRYSLIQCYF